MFETFNRIEVKVVHRFSSEKLDEVEIIWQIQTLNRL
jgi:hypothetical protein